METKKRKVVLLSACAILVMFSVIVRENATQKAWYCFFAAGGVTAGYSLRNKLRNGRWSAALFMVVMVTAALSLHLGWGTFTCGRWLATPIVNLFIPGLFPLMLPLVLFLKDQSRPLLAATTLGVMMMLTLLMKSFDGLLVSSAGLIGLLEREQKAGRAIVITLAATMYGALIYHDLNGLLPVSIEPWDGLRIVGHSRLQTMDTFFQTAVLEDPYYISGEVLYCFGVLPFVLLFSVFGVLIACMITDWRKSTAKDRLSMSCMVFFGVKTITHLISVAALLTSEGLITQAGLPLTGSGFAVFAEFLLLAWVLCAQASSHSERINILKEAKTSAENGTTKLSAVKKYGGCN